MVDVDDVPDWFRVRERLVFLTMNTQCRECTSLGIPVHLMMVVYYGAHWDSLLLVCVHYELDSIDFVYYCKSLTMAGWQLVTHVLVYHTHVRCSFATALYIMNIYCGMSNRCIAFTFGSTMIAFRV